MTADELAFRIKNALAIIDGATHYPGESDLHRMLPYQHAVFEIIGVMMEYDAETNG